MRLIPSLKVNLLFRIELSTWYKTRVLTFLSSLLFFSLNMHQKKKKKAKLSTKMKAKEPWVVIKRIFHSSSVSL